MFFLFVYTIIFTNLIINTKFTELFKNILSNSNLNEKTKSYN